MKIVSFDRAKYNRVMEAFKTRKSPNYIVEAYHHGHVEVINLYYREKINKKLGKPSSIVENKSIDYLHIAEADTNRRFIQEAARKKDMDFLKLFYQVTGMDILSGNKLPPKAGQLLKQAPTKSFKLTDIFKRQ